MSALDELPPAAADPAPARACEYWRRGQPACGSIDGLVRVFWGIVCRAHLLPGAQVYEVLWLSPTPPAGPGLVVASDGTLRAPGTGRDNVTSSVVAATRLATVHQLPDAGRAVAAAHADAAPGEANGARLVAYRAGKIRARVLDHLVAVGARGTTAIEAWLWYRDVHALGTERYSVAPRLSEMVTDGWAVKTGVTRNVRGEGYPPEEVYRLSPQGRAQLGVVW